MENAQIHVINLISTLNGLPIICVDAKVINIGSGTAQPLLPEIPLAMSPLQDSSKNSKFQLAVIPILLKFVVIMTGAQPKLAVWIPEPLVMTCRSAILLTTMLVSLGAA